MRIIFMGTPDFAVSSLKALAKSRHDIIAVFTRKDAPKNRKMKLFPPPVKVCAQELDIPVYQPSTLKSEETQSLIKSLCPDIIVVAAYGRILPPAVLSVPKYGCINVHASLLPKYRGASPINAVLLNGESESGVTIMQMAEGLDTGDMLTKTQVEIKPDDSFGTLHDKLAIAGAELLIKTLDDIENGNISPQKQDDSLSCYAPMIKNEDSALDFCLDAASVSQKIRAFDPVPGAFCYLDSLKIKLFSAVLCENNSENMCGKVISCDKKGIVIACKKGTFLVREIQAAGGKRMPVSAYCAGHGDLTGKIFGGCDEKRA